MRSLYILTAILAVTLTCAAQAAAETTYNVEPAPEAEQSATTPPAPVAAPVATTPSAKAERSVTINNFHPVERVEVRTTKVVHRIPTPDEVDRAIGRSKVVRDLGRRIEYLEDNPLGGTEQSHKEVNAYLHSQGFLTVEEGDRRYASAEHTHQAVPPAPQQRRASSGGGQTAVVIFWILLCFLTVVITRKRLLPALRARLAARRAASP